MWNANVLDDEIGVNKSSFANVSTGGEKSDEDYDFLISGGEVKSNSDDDLTKAKENVMKD